MLQACGFFQALIPLVSSDFLSCRLLLLSSDASLLPLPSPTHTHTHTVHTWPTWIIPRDADGLQFSNGAFSLRLTSLKRDLRVPKTGHFLSWLCESAHAVPSAWISLRMLHYSEMLPPLSVPGDNARGRHCPRSTADVKALPSACFVSESCLLHLSSDLRTVAGAWILFIPLPYVHFGPPFS